MSDLVLFSLEYKLKRIRCIFHFFFSFFIPIMSRIGFLKKIMQTSKQAWCLFPFSPHFHILLYKSLQPMTPRVQLHPLPSQALLFFPKELIWSCCQPAGTFHAQRMFICSGILRLHHEGGLKNQLAVTWVAGVIIAENWSVQWLQSWKQHLENKPSTAETGAHPEREGQSHQVLTHTLVLQGWLAHHPGAGWAELHHRDTFCSEWLAEKILREKQGRQISPGNPWER